MLIDPPPDTSGRPTFRPMVQNKFSRLRSTGNGYIPCRGYAPCQVLSNWGYSPCQIVSNRRYSPCQVLSIEGTHRTRYFPIGGTRRARYFPCRLYTLCQYSPYQVSYLGYSLRQGTCLGYSLCQMAYLGYSHCQILPSLVWEILTMSGSPLEVCMPETFPRTHNADTFYAVNITELVILGAEVSE
jgi:hypothetical protein